jgi:3-phenylpropionate/cinnamic acid dioxygenase small subunit
MSEVSEAQAQAAAPANTSHPSRPARLARDARYYELKREIEEFLYDEANLLDDRQFDDWLPMLADDLEYFMPMEFNVKFGDHARRELTTREQQMSWFNEGKWTLGKRVEQIMTGVHWAEEPLSRVSRLVSNVQLTAIHTGAQGELEVDVSSRFLTYQNRCEREQYFFVGDRKDRMRQTAEGWKLCRREIRIHQNVLLAKNLSIFF